MLVLSTVPLHLLYNSVIFTSRSAVDYRAALVTKDFVRNGWWDHSLAGSVLAVNVEQLERLAVQAENLTRLDNAACLHAYASSMYETNWRNVLVVTSMAGTNSSLINVYVHAAAASASDLGWVCHGDIHKLYAPEYSACSAEILHGALQSWSIPQVPGCPQSPEDRLGYGYDLLDRSENCPSSYNVPVEYCLAESFPAQCTTNISTSLLAVVIVCNVVKNFCMLAVLCARVFRPLSTVGDAITSFMERPDPVTAGKGALEVDAVTSGVWRQLDRHPPSPWMKRKRPWWYAVPRLLFNLTLLMCFIPWLSTLIIIMLLAKASQPGLFSTSGAIETNNLLPNTSDTGLLPNIILANTPQPIITLIYILLNSAFTRMLLDLEYLSFAFARKTLRVSRPQGQQRSTTGSSSPTATASPSWPPRCYSTGSSLAAFNIIF